MTISGLGRAAALLVLLTEPAGAFTALKLEFQAGAEATATQTAVAASLRLPIGPFANGQIETVLTEGAFEQMAWRFGPANLSTLQVIEPLRSQVTTAGFVVVFECETKACGGFDFRYGAPVLPEPDMHVDLGDFRYLVAKSQGKDGPEYISLFVSRSADAGYVQVTQTGHFDLAVGQTATSGSVPPAGEPWPLVKPEPGSAEVPQAVDGAVLDLVLGLQSGNSVALDDLVFASGSTSLVAGTYESLRQLAEFLEANPDRKVTLVGHTDASGGLEANIALSRLRAQSVRQTLLNGFEISPAQIDAEGVGFLAPRDSNLTEPGKQRNRRVEAILNLP